MESVPTTALAEILSGLSITDAQSFGRAMGMGREMNDTRTSLCRFLSTSFDDVYGLIASMIDSKSIIVGPRVLDYFIPGSSTGSDSWYFMVPQSLTSASRMLYALETCGVKWDSFLESFARLGENGDKEIISTYHWNITRLDKRSFESALEIKLRDMGEHPGSQRHNEMKGLLEDLWDIQSYVFGDGTQGIIHIIYRRGCKLGYDYETLTQEMAYITSLRPLMTATGTIGQSPGSPKVHLLISYYIRNCDNLIDLIRHMSFSHLMCLVSPFYALNLFYKDSCMRRSTRLANMSINMCALLIEEEYRNMGWTFENVPLVMPTFKNIGGGDAKVVYFHSVAEKFRSMLDISSGLAECSMEGLRNKVTMYQSNIENTYWHLAPSSRFVHSTTGAAATVRSMNILCKPLSRSVHSTATFSNLLAALAPDFDIRVSGSFISRFENPEIQANESRRTFIRVFGRPDVAPF